MRGKKKSFEFIVDENGCFVCTSHTTKNKNQPAITSKKGIKMSVPRYIYEECFGLIPKGQVVRHKCDNGSCLNPEHMELGTQIENIQDMVERGRSIHGERNHFSKLKLEEVEQIKSFKGKKPKAEVAREFNVSGSQIYRIWNGDNWAREVSV